MRVLGSGSEKGIPGRGNSFGSKGIGLCGKIWCAQGIATIWIQNCVPSLIHILNKALSPDTPMLQYLEIGPLGGNQDRLSHKGRAQMQQDYCPYKKIHKKAYSSLSHSLCMCAKVRPCEVIVRSPPSTTQGEFSPDTDPVSTLISDFQSLEVYFCCFSHPAYGILLWQPDSTETSNLIAGEKDGSGEKARDKAED